MNSTHETEKYITSNGKQISVLSIIRAEEINNITYLFFHDNEVSKSVLTIDELEWELPNDIFIRVHSNHLINKNHSKKFISINTSYLELSNGHKIPVSNDLVNDSELFSKKSVLYTVTSFFKRIFSLVGRN